MRSSGPTQRKRNGLHVLLGGADLEMRAIGDLARTHLGVDHVHDAGLAWGAKASTYLALLERLLAAGETPALVELADDLPAGIDRQKLIVIDHHGALAGADRPSSLRQIFDLLDLPVDQWTREFALIEGNDVGHIRALRAMGASAEDVRRIRDADRAAQGVTPEDEAAARAALARAEADGKLTLVRLPVSRTSPVGDFIEPEYGGQGAANLLIETPSGLSFFGDGAVVEALAAIDDAWWGGALPERGFWGVSQADAVQRAMLIDRVKSLLK